MNVTIKNRLKKLEGRIEIKQVKLEDDLDFIREVAERTEPFDRPVDEKIKEILNHPNNGRHISVEERINRLIAEDHKELKNEDNIN